MQIIQAVKDKIIVKIMKQEEKTEGGIIVPDSVVNEPQLYTEVISVGKDVDEINIGDTVLCHRNGGMDIVVKNQIYKVLKDDEVYGIFKKE
jgi:chaperonin GroES